MPTGAQPTAKSCTGTAGTRSYADRCADRWRDMTARMGPAGSRCGSRPPWQPERRSTAQALGRSAQAIVTDETDVILPALEIPEYIAEAAE